MDCGSGHRLALCYIHSHLSFCVKQSVERMNPELLYVAIDDDGLDGRVKISSRIVSHNPVY